MDPEGWERRVAALAASLGGGWAMPPLIAQFRAGVLSVRDGNHRLGALGRLGRANAPVLIWFGTVGERNNF